MKILSSFLQFLYTHSFQSLIHDENVVSRSELLILTNTQKYVFPSFKLRLRYFNSVVRNLLRIITHAILNHSFDPFNRYYSKILPKMCYFCLAIRDHR